MESALGTTQPDWLIHSPFPLQPTRPVRPVRDITAGGYTDRVLATIAPAVDRDFYRAAAALPADADPVRHFAEQGWQAGLAPNAWFDTQWYLATYTDIRQAGMNPLFHYLAFGQREGRLPRRPGGPARHLVEQASVPAQRRPGYDAPADAERLDTVALGHHIAAACAGARGLVLAVSHDCYIHVTGGMQILIADEQALFAADRFAYLHLAPAIARLTLAPDNPADEAATLLQVVLDGRFLGLATAVSVQAALRRPPAAMLATRLFVVHSVFGHAVPVLAGLAAALRPAHSFFWLHDYAALCEGFNLLRNDIAYCHAPPPESTACLICVYGAARQAYLAALGRLFTAVPFHVLAPSRAALDLFLARSDLPCRSARVHENLVMAGETALPHRGEGPLNVAFVGYAMPQKGWGAFQRLLQRMAGRAECRFHHFAIPAAHVSMTALVNVPVRVAPDDRMAMVRALRAAEIDLVLVLSPWPETFSYVTYEAFAAGADVVALADSGNVADAIRRHGRGVVLADAEALLRFFDEGYALDYTARRAAGGTGIGNLLFTGTTATVDLAGLSPVTPEIGLTDDPDLAVLLPAGTIQAGREGEVLRFDLPPRAGEIRLVSRRTLPGLAPGRRGVAVAALALDDTPVALDDARLGAGWLAPQGGLRWTDGDAVLDVGRARVLELVLAPGVRYRRLAFATSPVYPD